MRRPLRSDNLCSSNGSPSAKDSSGIAHACQNFSDYRESHPCTPARPRRRYTGFGPQMRGFPAQQVSRLLIQLFEDRPAPSTFRGGLNVFDVVCTYYSS